VPLRIPHTHFNPTYYITYRTLRELRLNASCTHIFAVYTLAKELYPGRFTPTLTHTFISLLNTHSLLHTCFTQNIDTLERLAGVPEDKIVEAHGSFATQRCIDCKVPFDGGKMKTAVEQGEVPRCERRRCGGLVKPDIVFFEEPVGAKYLIVPTLSMP